METDLAGKKVLMVVAPKDFRDEEYLEPRGVLEEAEVEIVVVSKEVEKAIGAYGAKVVVDEEIGNVAAADFDAVVFVGGPGSKVYFDDQTALDLAKDKGHTEIADLLRKRGAKE